MKDKSEGDKKIQGSEESTPNVAESVGAAAAAASVGLAVPNVVGSAGAAAAAAAVEPAPLVVMQVRDLSAEAMRLLMLRDENGYLDAMYALAAACADLINNHGRQASEVINIIEGSMHEAYEPNLQRVVGQIGYHQAERAQIDMNTMFGMAQDDRLIARIDALQRTRKTPLADLIEGVVTDTMVRANRDYGAALDIDLMGYRPH
ncbi:hypothetical protein [Legionella hackeliae]|uniref:Uncharacterized protein n=1 Tax=Legionella hackeliae TaxID=449 RepID=A0A0A8UNG5_LEGHA|nr:hypothetical protein [Legionella hackeliae]KTD08864.1 hypothetical protein Lhac_3087 [Legionella hackeliae]CEK10293.1 protein of unknown function [Legionella hackeliae]STX47023.1 Uncharacterised protein [Legionella hackeliae]